MKLLIKFPSRERPEKFFQALDKYIQYANNTNKIAFLLSFDADDVTMNNDVVKNRLKKYQDQGIKLVYFFGSSKTKIQAVNADIEKVTGWDVLLLASDDMIPVVQGYDDIIRKDMNDHFRDFDGVLWYSDGGQNNINTLCILGKKYYHRFNYIYYPEYISLWCDNEFTEVSSILNKVYKSEKIIIEHQHPVYKKTQYDPLYAKNESYYSIDEITFNKRKAINFNLDSFNKKIFSILIASVPERLEKLDKLFKNLQNQITNNGLYEKVEILALLDNKLKTVGSKRQALLETSSGRFVAYLDDDDTVSNDYVKEIVTAAEQNPNVDVICFKQEARIENDPPVPVYFGLQYENTEYTYGKPIYRKPFHICAWNTKIAKQVKFKDISFTEDWTWVEELCKIAKTQHSIDNILHYYIYNSNTTTSKW
jgi:hypothetical protein